MKKTLIFREKRIFSVGFFGLGKSNLALLDYLSKNYEGLSFTLRSDTDAVKKDCFERVFLGKEARKEITEDLLFLSPSVRRDSRELSDAVRRGVILSSDVEFFFENRKIPVFSVTGTDGKSTTATLTSLMLSDSTDDFPAAANIGVPMVTLLEKEKLLGAVAELSSFQLMNFSPKSERALITNISENHLDWHTSLEEYASAKENLLRFSDKRIFNLDCPHNRALSEKYPAFAVFSRKIGYEEMLRRVAANHYFSVENGYISASGKPLFKREKIKLSGEHNLSNFLAAMALSAELTSVDKIVKVAESFEGLSHRTDLIGIFEGVSFYDSSIDSTPTRTATTLKAIKSPVILILGGRGKGLSYAPLFPIPKNVRAVVLTGENRGEILTELMNSINVSERKISIFSAEDFKDAVLIAIKQARAGDSVILSPASTSFDRFSDYKERGNTFSSLIKKYYAEK